MKILYTIVQDAADWQSLTSGRDNTRWFHDADCTRPATIAEADAASEDIYTDAGWNIQPTKFPALAHIEV